MSRGFVKEDDQEEVPIVPQRAFLPAGVTNFVTKSGFDQLLDEKKKLINERDTLNTSDDNERRIAINYLNAKLQLLNERISCARLVDSIEHAENVISFGATAEIRNLLTGENQKFQIVGVDEADIVKGKISFISPLSRALINKKTGDKITIKQNGKDIVYEILSISY